MKQEIEMATLKPSLVLCMLAFFCVFSFVPAQAATQSDFFYLNLLWPGSYCRATFFTKCCMPTTGEPALDFLVESLETYDSYSGNAVTNCNSTCSFFVNLLRDNITDMFTYWADVSCPNNNGVDLWHSTFCKYGPCCSLNQTTYFLRALDIRKKHDILGYLASKGIVPSETAKYNLEDIESALRPKLAFSFVLECNRMLPWFDDQLLRIKICISGDGNRIISCPISKKTTCHDKVIIPPFTSSMLSDEVFDEGNPIKMPFERDQIV